MEVKWRLSSNEVAAIIQGEMDEVCKEGAEMIAEDARSLAPKKTGKLASEIDVRTSKYEGGGYVVEAQGAGNYDKYYAAFVEVGTHKMAAQPYMRPAVKKNRKKIQKLMQDKLDNL